MTLTEYTSNQSRTTTVVLAKDGVLRGVGSKQITLTSSADPVIQVTSNMYDWAKTAIIENLIIDKAAGYEGAGVGILLQDVYSCLIRNVVIKNCNIGIKITATSGKWSEANNIQHVRMLDVNKGIVFDKGAGTGSFGFSNISSVGISLKTGDGKVGIEVGSGSKPYASFIKANCWMDGNSVGMDIYGEIRYSLINLNVEKPGGTKTGIGVRMSADNIVTCNQSFFLSTGNILNPIYPPGRVSDIINPACANY